MRETTKQHEPTPKDLSREGEGRGAYLDRDGLKVELQAILCAGEFEHVLRASRAGPRLAAVDGTARNHGVARDADALRQQRHLHHQRGQKPLGEKKR